MTEDNKLTLVSKKLLPISVALAGSIVLAACSSKPSPWSESSSPWDSRAQETAEVEPVEMEPVEPMQVEEIEPVGMMAMEETAMPVEAEMIIEEPMPEQVMMLEEAPAEPMMMQGGIAAQPAGYFAVQVVASSSMEQLTAFASQNQLSTEWVAQTSVNGKVWHVLMLGVYPTRAEAEQALLSVQNLGTQPWIRTVGSVQAVMN